MATRAQRRINASVEHRDRRVAQRAADSCVMGVIKAHDVLNDAAGKNQALIDDLILNVAAHIENASYQGRRLERARILTELRRGRR